MAMIDYGAIAFKNGRLISKGMFTPMIDMVGWEDNDDILCYSFPSGEKIPLSLRGNCFAYMVYFHAKMRGEVYAIAKIAAD